MPPPSYLGVSKDLEWMGGGGGEERGKGGYLELDSCPGTNS